MYRLAYELTNADPGPLAITAATVVFVFWALGWLLIAKHAFDTKTYGAPVLASSALLAYALCFVFVWPQSRSLASSAELFFGILAVVLLTQTVLYSGRTMAEQAYRDNALTVVLWAAGAAAVVLGAVVHHFEQTDGLVAALLVLAVVATTYPTFALLKPDASHVSRPGQTLRVLADFGLAFGIWLWVPFAGAVTASDPVTANSVLSNALLCLLLFSDLMLLTILYAPRRS